MRATINGEGRELPDGMTIADLLQLLGAPETGIAVARNDRVVRRTFYGMDRIDDGDRVEIIRAVPGG